VCSGFIPHMALSVGITCLHKSEDGHCLGFFFVFTIIFHVTNISQIFPFFLCIGAHALGFVGYVCSINFYLPFDEYACFTPIFIAY
jgi:hypothetical protein